MSIERRYRLKRSLDFARVRNNGKSWPHRLVILSTSQSDQPISRFGFITSKRVGNAVQRNRARRLLREAVRQNLSHIAAGWDCVFIARKSLPEATFGETNAAVILLLKRAKLWHSQNPPQQATINKDHKQTT